jgi:trehalose 6-phosphate phosphatase
MASAILKGAAEVAELADAVARKPHAAALFTDVDGTISPIVADPYAATVPAEFRAALTALAPRLGLLAIVTGRDLAQARAMVDIPGAAYVGLHGFQLLEPGGEPRGAEGAQPYVGAVQELATAAERGVAQRHPGVVVENKLTMVDVHYRKAADTEAARRDIEVSVAAPARERGLEIATGHFVIEVRPPLPLSKGTAIAELLATRPHLATAVICGDDLTDVTGFAAVRAWAAGAGRRTCYAVAALTGETPAAVKAAADIWVDATPGVYEVLTRLVAATAG